MKLPRREFLRLAAGAVVLPAALGVARAQSYPSRPVRFVVGFAPGGGGDLATRLMAQWLSERLGQQFVVENRVGASSNLATEQVVRAPAESARRFTCPANCSRRWLQSTSCTSPIAVSRQAATPTS